VGGMTLGTLLTLFVVPMFYTVFARGHVQKTTPEAPAPSNEISIPSAAD
jgi:hypothetical protein